MNKTNNSSKTKRTNPLFLRNQFVGDGKFGIPIVKKQDISLENLWFNPKSC